MVAVTSRGLPYPEESDHTRTWEHWQALAEAVDADLNGPVYTDLVLSAGFVARGVTWHTPSYRVLGQEVQMRGHLQKSAGNMTSGASPFVVPADARPVKDLSLPISVARATGTSVAGRLDISTAGTILVYLSDVDAGPWVSLDGVRYIKS